MIPFYIYYSMFGFQRVGDLAWAAGDMRSRGFLLGGTAGRTTLNGEGLQHEDGHSLLLAATNPACIAYDPAWAYELSYIMQDALRRMYGSSEEHPHGEDIFYYLTMYNEPYLQPAEPAELDVDGLLLGLYRYQPAPDSTRDADGSDNRPRAQILASGPAMQWALDAQRMLAEDWGVAADVWSATSWTELRREALACDKHNLLHPGEPARTPYVTRTLLNAPGPVLAVSDWMRAVPDQIAQWVPGDYSSLGTDGFGRSDTRGALRRYFHVDAHSITAAVLQELAQRGEVSPEIARDAVDKYQLLDVTAAPRGETGGET
jgi:pyruvate dehydrogenase E1 component